MTTINMRAGDTAPALDATLMTSDGTPIDLSGATVKAVMREKFAPFNPIVDHATAVVVDALAGKVRYNWTVPDTNTVGVYSFGFVVTFSGGTIRSVPSSGDGIEVVINPPL